jgi:hypothetical protein
LKNFAAFSLVAVALTIAAVGPPISRAEAADVWKAKLLPMTDGGSVPTAQYPAPGLSCSTVPNPCLARKGWYTIQADFAFCYKPFVNDGGVQTADCSKDHVSERGASYNLSPFAVDNIPMANLFDGIAIKPLALEGDGGVPINTAAGICANGALGCANLFQVFPMPLGTSDHP